MILCSFYFPKCTNEAEVIVGGYSLCIDHRNPDSYAEVYSRFMEGLTFDQFKSMMIKQQEVIYEMTKESFGVE